MNLYLDDIRIPMDSQKMLGDPRYTNLDWVIVRSYDEFVEIIQQGYSTTGRLPELISFDHDLADEHYDSLVVDYQEKTGMECAKWLVEFCMDHMLRLPEYLVHSSNPSGKENIIGLFKSFSKFNKSS